MSFSLLAALAVFNAGGVMYLIFREHNDRFPGGF